MSNYNFTVNKTDLDIMKTTNDSNNLTEHLQVKVNTDVTSGNYSYSTAIKILDDVAKSPVDTNVSEPLINYFCQMSNFYILFRPILFVIYVYMNFTTGKIIRNINLII